MFSYFNPIEKETKTTDYRNRINSIFENIINNAGGKINFKGNITKEPDINNEDYLNLLALFTMQLEDKDIKIYGFNYDNANLYYKTRINDIIMKLPADKKKIIMKYLGIGSKKVSVEILGENNVLNVVNLLPLEDRSLLEYYYGLSFEKDRIEVKNNISFYCTSKYTDLYFEYIKNVFFRGLTPEEFEQNEELMKGFNNIKIELKHGHITKEYDDEPTYSKVFKRKQEELGNIHYDKKDKDIKPIYLNDLIKVDELSKEALEWRNIIIDKLRKIKKHDIKDFVNNENLIIGIAKREKDLILKSAAYQLIYEDEEYKDKLSYIINK